MRGNALTIAAHGNAARLHFFGNRFGLLDSYWFDLIDEIPDNAKLVVLTTGRLDSWKPDSPEVDAITSASTVSETDAVARIIADKVRGIVNSQNNI